MNNKEYDDDDCITFIYITTPLDDHYNIYPKGTIKGVDEEIVLVEKILDIPKTDKILAVPIGIMDYPRELLGTPIWEFVDINFAVRLPPRPKGGRPYSRILIRMKSDFLYKFNYERIEKVRNNQNLRKENSGESLEKA